jgi:hypothetical protein
MEKSRNNEEWFNFTLALYDNKECEETLGYKIISSKDFNVKGFEYRSLDSIQLKETVDEIVHSIVQDLNSKSRIFTWLHTPYEIKLTGFQKEYIENYFCGIEKVEDESYIAFYQHPETTIMPLHEVEEQVTGVENWSHTFVFTFSIINGDGSKEVILQKAIDGSVYPKYVRETLDITNNVYALEYLKEEESSFKIALLTKMMIGKENLVYNIINKFTYILSYKYTKEYDYTDSLLKTDKVEYKTTYFEPVKNWERTLNKKTNAYFDSFYPTYADVTRIETKL